MPRFSRPIPGGLCVHVVTRGNARATVFHADDDCATFRQLMADAQRRVRLEIFAWCLMPNHVHFVMRPRADGDLARWMHWLLTAHVQRHRVRHKTTGRIWQGRYKAFPIQADAHLLTVLRYVERNPVRAGLAMHAVDWRWSSARESASSSHDLARVITGTASLAVARLGRHAVDGRRACRHPRAARNVTAHSGEASWTREVADRLDLLGTLRPRGRPKVKCRLRPSGEIAVSNGGVLS